MKFFKEIIILFLTSVISHGCINTIQDILLKKRLTSSKHFIQIVVLGEVFFEVPSEISSGVPTGGKLGPFLRVIVFQSLDHFDSCLLLSISTADAFCS